MPPVQLYFSQRSSPLQLGNLPRSAYLDHHHHHHHHHRRRRRRSKLQAFRHRCPVLGNIQRCEVPKRGSFEKPVYAQSALHRSLRCQGQWTFWPTLLDCEMRFLCYCTLSTRSVGWLLSPTRTRILFELRASVGLRTGESERFTVVGLDL